MKNTKKYNLKKSIFSKDQRQLIGRLNTLQKMVKKRKERIEQNKKEIQECLIEITERKSELKELQKVFEPKVYLIKNVGYKKRNIQGKVYFMGKSHRFHICTVEYQNDYNMSDDKIKDMGKRCFWEYISRKYGEVKE